MIVDRQHAGTRGDVAGLATTGAVASSRGLRVRVRDVDVTGVM